MHSVIEGGDDRGEAAWSESYSIIAGKAHNSLKRNETRLIKDWLKAVIDELDLMSLESFPAKEITVGFPDLVKYLDGYLSPATEKPPVDSGLREFASLLATMRKEQTFAVKVFEDYAALRRRVLKAASTGLRGSDASVLEVFLRLDEGLMTFFRIAIEASMARQSADLQQLASTDALTGLFNVRHFKQKLHENIEICKRYQIPFSLVTMDLDKFKALNDQHGHQMGDQALKRIARLIVEEKREIDTAVRYGGDEFFLLLPGTGASEAESLAERIVARNRKERIIDGGPQMPQVSVGIVDCPRHATEGRELRFKADQALYRAKQAGGSAIVIYQET